MGNSNSKKGFRCERCFTHYKNENDKVELSCVHLSCKSCILFYTTRALSDSDLSLIKCPVRADCMSPVPIGILKLILEDIDFQRYERLVRTSMPPLERVTRPTEPLQEIRVPRLPEPLQRRVTLPPGYMQGTRMRPPAPHKGLRLPRQLPPKPTPSNNAGIGIKNPPYSIPCPNCGMYPIETNAENFRGVCPRPTCAFNLCTNCNQEYHAGDCNSGTETNEQREKAAPREDHDLLMQRMRTLIDQMTISEESNEAPSSNSPSSSEYHTASEEGIEEEPPTSPTTIKCNICLEDIPTSRIVDLGCGCNTSCKECIIAFFQSCINDGNIHGLRCPNPECGLFEANPTLIRELVGKDHSDKLENLLLGQALNNIPEAVKCPKPGCGQWLIAEPEYGFCQSCDFRFCSECNQPFHGLSECWLTEEERKVVMRRYLQQASEEERARFIGKRKKENRASERLIRRLSKKCPFCNINIEKLDGCNHMHCTNCNTHFCWLCLLITRQNKRGDPYQHYNESNCVLFEVPQEQ